MPDTPPTDIVVVPDHINMQDVLVVKGGRHGPGFIYYDDGGREFELAETVRNQADEIARLRAEVVHTRSLLWIGWYEMNAIRAETGVPIGANGLRKSIDPDYWSASVDRMEDALGDDAKPWPPEALHKETQ